MELHSFSLKPLYTNPSSFHKPPGTPDTSLQPRRALSRKSSDTEPNGPSHPLTSHLAAFLGCSEAGVPLSFCLASRDRMALVPGQTKKSAPLWLCWLCPGSLHTSTSLLHLQPHPFLWFHSPGHSTHGPESPPGREIKGTVRVPMAVVNTDISGLSPRNPHYIPG